MTPKQIILVVIGVVALAGGITYVRMSIGPSRGSEPEGTVPNREIPSPLVITPDIQAPRFEEAFTAGHHAFRYKSQVDKPTTVGVNWKNCICASVEICIAPNEWKALPEAELIKKADDASLEWTPLDKDGNGFDIPAKAIGWVRIGWNADKSTDQRFKADLWLYEADSGIGFPLEIPVSFVEAVRVRWWEDPDKVDPYVGRLGPGEHKDATLVIWSSTRESFTLEADPPRVDPCLKYGSPKKLKAEELEFLTQRHSRKALSGYQVAVTVYEKAGDQQLDIGPFRREVRWKSDAVKDGVRAHVQGIVLGEVTAHVADSPNEPRLDMGAIDPDRPRIHKVTLETENPQVELALDDATCELLKVVILDGKEGKRQTLGDGVARTTWNVNVSFRSDSGFRGPFPDRERPGELTAIVFRITHAGVGNEPPRRLKIMVRGQVRN